VLILNRVLTVGSGEFDWSEVRIRSASGKEVGAIAEADPQAQGDRKWHLKLCLGKNANYRSVRRRSDSLRKSKEMACRKAPAGVGVVGEGRFRLTSFRATLSNEPHALPGMTALPKAQGTRLQDEPHMLVPVG
jgi:hypothetical protein